MYRSPEMIDLYSNNPVNEKADIWVSQLIMIFITFIIAFLTTQLHVLFLTVYFNIIFLFIHT